MVIRKPIQTCKARVPFSPWRAHPSDITSLEGTPLWHHFLIGHALLTSLPPTWPHPLTGAHLLGAHRLWTMSNTEAPVGHSTSKPQQTFLSFQNWPISSVFSIYGDGFPDSLMRLRTAEFMEISPLLFLVVIFHILFLTLFVISLVRELAILLISHITVFCFYCAFHF